MRHTLSMKQSALHSCTLGTLWRLWRAGLAPSVGLGCLVRLSGGRVKRGTRAGGWHVTDGGFGSERAVLEAVSRTIRRVLGFNHPTAHIPQLSMYSGVRIQPGSKLDHGWVQA